MGKLKLCVYTHWLERIGRKSEHSDESHGETSKVLSEVTANEYTLPYLTRIYRLLNKPVSSFFSIVVYGFKIINTLQVCCCGFKRCSDCVDHNKLWKILKEMGIPDHLTCFLETYMPVRKQQLELDMEQQTGSKSGKEYAKAVYCHPAYFTYM